MCKYKDSSLIVENSNIKKKKIYNNYPYIESNILWLNSFIEEYRNSEQRNITEKNPLGTKYYKVKNSWGKDTTRVANGGFVYFSEAYMRLKAISITVHKDALLKNTAKKLNL